MKNRLIICITILFILCLAVAGLTACSDPNDDGKMKIVVTIFPEYDWVENVLGDQSDQFNVILLQKNSADLHNFDPSPDDLINISKSDLFIYVGGESDEWVEDALKNPVNGKRKTLSLMDILGDKAREEETVEGMEEDEEEGEEEAEYDEHVWLSLTNARLFVSAIADALCELDEANGETYQTNADAYNEQLTALDEEYKAAIVSASVKTFVFGDRFPFLYMFKEYGLTYYAAFKGCSAESEASFSTIIFLAKKVDELGLKTIWTIESSDGKIARTVRDNTATKDQTILSLDSLQSGANGQTYLSAMRSNLEIIKQGL